MAARARQLDPAVLEYAKALVEYAERLRAERPLPPLGATPANVALALQALGYDPREVAEKVRARAEGPRLVVRKPFERIEEEEERAGEEREEEERQRGQVGGEPSGAGEAAQQRGSEPQEPGEPQAAAPQGGGAKGEQRRRGRDSSAEGAKGAKRKRERGGSPQPAGEAAGAQVGAPSEGEEEQSEGAEAQVGAPSESEGEQGEGEGEEEAGEAAEARAQREGGEGEEAGAGESEEEQGVEEGEEEEDEEEEGEGEPPSEPGEYNVEEVADLRSALPSEVRYYQTLFYRFLEMFAEEKTKLFDPGGAPEEYNIRKLMFRRYEGKPPSRYRMARVRESVVLILDDSGSMDWWEENLSILAELALQRGDVEIYIAPNGYIEKRLTKRGEERVNHKEVMKALRGRKVIYVGDYDGANTPIELSWRNEVVWICPESRYRRFASHNWVDYTERDFRGVFIRAYDLKEMFEGLKRLGTGTRWIDFHAHEEFRDDGGEEE